MIPNERSVLVTGAAGGIGRATVFDLAGKGCRVVCAVRSQAAADSLRAEVLGVYPGARIETVTGDLSRLDQVRSLAGQVQGPLDTLVLNAGIVTTVPEDTPDGHDVMLAVNHLSGFLLTALLWKKLQESGSPRVVVVSSYMHAAGRIALDDLGARRGLWLGGWRQYGCTKQMNVHFARELARRFPSVAANALHPGSYGTGLSRRSQFSFVLRGLLKVPEDAGRGLVRLAVSPEVDGVTGCYFDIERKVEPSKAARDPHLAAGLWDATARLVGAQPG